MDEQNTEGLLKRISDLENQVHELEKDLIHDSLTGLKTRAFFEEESTVFLDAISSVDTGKRKNWFGFKNISFLFFDIDHFKKINDTYGHDIGDAVLKKVAETIARSLREGDTAARFGGEEMIVSLLGANEADAVRKANSIREEISNLNFSEAPDLKITISVGVATADGVITCLDLVKKADQALYAAKNGGRNKVVAYSELNK